MPTVSIIAGSKSDEKFVKPIEEELKKDNITFETVYLSAHRDKEKLGAYVKNSDAEYFIAAAGLAAALPGSIAADTNKPVIAVPVWGGSASSPAGLDALLAAVQMPPPKDGKDVALGTVAINGGAHAATFVVNSLRIRQEKQKYDVIVDTRDYKVPDEIIKKLSENLKQIGLVYCIDSDLPESDNYDDARVVIMVTDRSRTISGYLKGMGAPAYLRQVVVLPLLQKQEVDLLDIISNPNWNYEVPADAPHPLELFNKLFNMAPDGPAVAVGFNRYDNAAILAKKLLGK